MDSKTFINLYNSLNNIHKHITFRTLYMMRKKPSKASAQTAIHQIIKKQRKKCGFGYTSLYKEIERKRGEVEGLKTSKKTYESVMRRKTIAGEMFNLICQTIQLQPEDFETIKLQAQIYDQGNLECLFNSLNEKNKAVISTLVNLLHIEETYPEYFDDF